jgi:crossover junction endodeoxyribonuclease RuvC
VRVLGIDPGTAVTGYGVVDSLPGHPGRLVECGVIRTRADDGLPLRLRAIHEGLRDLITTHAPDVVAVEGMFHRANARTTATLGHARGVVLLAAAQAGLPVAEYPPAVVKKTVVDRGAAQKHQVGFMVARLLGLKEAPSPSDAADGVAVALTHLLRAVPLRRLARVAR